MNRVQIFSNLPNGKVFSYDVIMTLRLGDKNCVIYTDNKYDLNNRLRIFASIYNPLDNGYVGNNFSNEEWKKIVDVVDRVLLN